MLVLHERSILSVLVTCLITLAFLALSHAAHAQERFTARSITSPEPEVVSAAARAFAVPMSDEEANERQDLIGTHHRPTPIAELLQDPPVFTPPAPASDPMPAPRALAQSFFINHVFTDIETANATSTVNEPSVGARGNEVLVTGNWFAAFSTDGGASFNYINPSNAFPASPHGTFCCDQIALYDARYDIMLWFLQYTPDSSQNTIRLAVAQGADIDAQQWRFYDFTPMVVGNWQYEWFDYPDLSVGNANLYITSNAFSTVGTGDFTRAVIIRMPLAELAGYQPLNVNVWDTTANGSLRLTQGAGDTVYFASHVSAETLRVFEWPESGTTITQNDVSVTSWPYAGVRPGWTRRSDHRITAGWISGDELGFGWTASAGQGFFHPHARFAIINRNSMSVVDEPHLWNQNFPYAYPAAAPNGSGRVAISVMFGDEPSHALGVLDTATTPRTWNLVTTRTGTHAPDNDKLGDYLSVRVHGTNPDSWVATGFTLQGGTTRNFVETQYLHFDENQVTIP